MFQKLLRLGVIVRPIAAYGMPGHLRVSIGLESENARFLDALKQAFNDDIAAVQLANCPGEGPSPDGWHYDRDPTVTAGMIACGTYKNHPNVIWSNEGKLMLSDVFGDPATIDDLHNWWAKYG